jgi:hypothetical protein
VAWGSLRHKRAGFHAHARWRSFQTKILLATDGSEAAKLAAQLANETGSELHVVCVEEVPVTASACAIQGVPIPTSEGNRELLHEQVMRKCRA